MTTLANIPEGFKLVPLELSDEQAEKIANSEIDHNLKLQNRTRSDYLPSQLNDWIQCRKLEAKKRYAAALALLD